ncbi:hypothetical protein NW849_00875 [Synechococcus sp. R55.3]|uniref:hypothetical protein n=1 Tax=unclassified Synechococcus TaxID=2626047 RepID=UPI0039C08A53
MADSSITLCPAPQPLPQQQTDPGSLFESQEPLPIIGNIEHSEQLLDISRIRWTGQQLPFLCQVLQQMLIPPVASAGRRPLGFLDQGHEVLSRGNLRGSLAPQGSLLLPLLQN